MDLRFKISATLITVLCLMSVFDGCGSQNGIENHENSELASKAECLFWGEEAPGRRLAMSLLRITVHTYMRRSVSV